MKRVLRIWGAQVRPLFLVEAGTFSQKEVKVERFSQLV